MAGIRDPAFWRRFSVAVHLEEPKTDTTMFSQTERLDLKHTESWLDRQEKKKKRTRCLGWLIVFCAIISVGGIAVLIWFLDRHGFFLNGHK